MGSQGTGSGLAGIQEEEDDDGAPVLTCDFVPANA